MSGGSLALELQEQRDAWDARPLVRTLYRGWYERMMELLSALDGPTVEVGAGIGSFKESHPAVVATDIEATPWSDRVADAQALPYDDGALANLVGVDVVHHLPHPAKFLAEAERTLRPGGRLVLLEPYGSPLSTVAYKIGHREAFDLSVDPFAPIEHSSDRPLDANGALPTLLFFRRADELRRHHAGLEIVHRERLAVLAYALSGGFLGRPLVPNAAARPLLALERFLERPVARIGAFRCLVALERRGS